MRSSKDDRTEACVRILMVLESSSGYSYACFDAAHHPIHSVTAIRGGQSAN